MVMIKNLFFIFIISLSFSVWASVSVVSDLDDTIKITNSGDEIDGAVNATFRSDVFVGMNELWMGMESYSNEQHILSASPGVLRLKIVTTLKKHQIGYTSIILKNPLKKEDKLTYKVRMIEEIMKTNPDQFVFLGDDVGQDPEAYDVIKQRYPDRVLMIYIRPVKNRKLPASSKIFYTNFDVALNEYQAGRMSASWVETVADRLIQTKKLDFIVPKFAYCPQTDEAFKTQYKTVYKELAQSISKKLVSYCLTR